MALDFFAKRKLRKEVKQLESKIKKGEDRPDIRLRLAGLYRKLENHDDAKKQYLIVTQSYLDLSKRGQAEAVCKSVLEYYPENSKFKELFDVIINGNKSDESEVEIKEDSLQIEEEDDDNDAVVEYLMDDFVDTDEPTPIATYNNFKDLQNSSNVENSNWGENSTSQSGENRIPTPPSGVPHVTASLHDSISKRLENKKNQLNNFDSKGNDDGIIDIFGDNDFFGSEGDTVIKNDSKGDFWTDAPLLRDLSPELREELRSTIKPSFHEPDEYIFREGDSGQSLYMIMSGEVSVTKLKPGGEDEEIATLSTMDFFGEFALMSDHKRHASIIATLPTSLIEIPKSLVVSIGKKHPSFISILKKFYKDRLKDMMIKNLSFFDLISPEKNQIYLNDILFHKFAPNTSIIKQGAKSGGFFLILIGEVEIVYKSDSEEKLLGVLGEGEYFGEMALMKRKPAMATVRSVDVVELVQIPAKTFFKILAENPPIWRKLQDEVSKRILLDHYFISGKGNGKIAF